MKVLVISAALPPVSAGEADHTFHLCRHLKERGVDVDVLTTAGEESLPSLPFKAFPLMRNWSWAELPKYVRFIRKCRPDAILLFYSDWIYNRHPMVTFTPLLSKLLLPGARFVTQLETESASIGASVFTRAFVKALSLCTGNRIDYVLGTLLTMSDRLVVLSDIHKIRLGRRRASLTGKTAVIPPPPLIHMASENGGEARRLGRNALGLGPDDFAIAYIGYIYLSKGVDVLFRAFRSLRERHSNLRLIMIGGDLTAPNIVAYAKQFTRMFKETGFGNEVVWTGPYDWDGEQASLYLRAADACVFPFLNGVTLNRSTLAAASAHGLPIVTTRGSFLEPAFIDRVNMLLCPPNQPESIAAAVESIISDPELRSRLRQGALRLARDWFSWDKAVDRTLDLLGLSDLPELNTPVLA